MMSNETPKNAFDGVKPLKYYITNKFRTKCDLHYYDFMPPKNIELIEFRFSRPIPENIKALVFGIEASEDIFTKYDFLFCPDGADFLLHNRVLKIFQEMCPDDFQRFDAVIKNLNPDDSPFENREFHMINVIHRIDVLDLDMSVYEIDEDGIFWLHKRVFRDDDCWNGHLLAREEQTNDILFHPKLAKKFRRSKGIQFLTDTEAP